MISELATLGGGCFWCLEAVYQELKGINQIVSGYAGGDLDNPTYQQVSTGTTGHAEVVQLSYDPEQISYRQILRVLFAIHDPTTRDRQGADVGPQYRSIILYHDQEQREIAEDVIAEIETAGLYPEPIVTEVAPLKAFYRAEDYHQNYYRDNPQQSYCQFVIAPKMAKFRKEFIDQLKKE